MAIFFVAIITMHYSNIAQPSTCVINVFSGKQIVFA